MTRGRQEVNYYKACRTRALNDLQLPKNDNMGISSNILTSKCASIYNGMHFSDISISKAGPNIGVFSFFTCKCASRHDGVHFFDISTAKSVLHILTWKCASRHNGVQFFISHLASWLRTRRFGDTHHWKNTECFATFLPCRAPGSSFFSDFIFCDLLSSSFLFSDSSRLCFSSVHIVGSLTSKLPSMICLLF